MNSDQILEELSCIEGAILTCERNYVEKLWVWTFNRSCSGVTVIIEKDGETSLQALRQIREEVEKVGQLFNKFETLIETKGNSK